MTGSSPGETGVPHDEILLRFTDAVLGDDDHVLGAARERLLAELGSAALVDACGVVATFQQMDRIADSTGIPLDTIMQVSSKAIRDEVGVERFPSAENTPRSAWRGFLERILSPVRPLLFRAVQAQARRQQAR